MHPAAPAPPPGGVPAHTLPRPLSSFVGRAADVERVARMCGAARLVTLTGPGGAGKTRLAREAAAVLAAEGAYPDGVWWVELAPLPHGGVAELAQVLAGVVGVRPEGDVAQALEAALAGWRALVVLDNCEHVVDAAAALAERLLRACPGLTLLATSREALGAEGEAAWQTPPLQVPPPARAAPAAAVGAVDRAAAPDALLAYEAVALFVERARAVVPSFALTDANAAAVASVVARLDGLPLAIELAAAALPTFGVDGLAARLDDALGVLTRGRRTALPRHKTLRAVLDWSYRLLAPAEQALLARLSVCRGAFPLAAVEAVAGALPGDTPALDALGRLVEHSLVDVREDAREAAADAADGGAGEPRYALLETVRQYGADRLRADPAAERAARRRHAEWLAGVAEALYPALWSPARARLMARLRRDLDDIQAALAWAAGPDGDALLAVRLGGSLGWLWITGLPWQEGRRWATLSADVGEAGGVGGPGRPVADRVAMLRALVFLGGTANYDGDTDRALDVARRLETLHAALAPEVAAAAAAGAPEAARWTLELRLAAASAHDVAAESLLRQGDVEGAIARSTLALAVTEAADHPWHAALLRGRRAGILGAVGRHAEALAEFGAAVASLRRLGETWLLAYSLEGMATSALALGRPAEAAAHAAESAAVLRAEPDLWFLSRAVDVLAAAVLAARPGPGPAAALAGRLLGAGHGLRRRSGSAVIDFDRARHAAAVAAAERALGPGPYAAAHAAGAALGVDAVFALAAEAGALVADAASANALRPDAPSGGAPVPPVPTAPVPTAPVPTAPVPTAPVPTALVPTAPVPAPPVPAPPALRLDVLGPFALWRDARRVPDDEAPAGKVRELLLWLLLHPQGTKEQIGLALWPDASPAQLRSSFHFTLHHLRRALGDPRWVAFAGANYRLERAPAAGGRLTSDADAVLDAAAALRDLARRQAAAGRAGEAPEPPDGAAPDALDAAAAALAAYRGDLDANTGAGSAAGEWLTAHQQRLRAAWADGTALFGVLLSAAGRHGEAVAAFERVLAADPLREGVHRALMQALAAAGEPARALAHYDALEALLARDLGAAPAPETRRVADGIRRGAATVPAGAARD